MMTIAWKATAILVAAFCAAACLRRRSASLRHFTWTAAFAALLILPAFSFVTPRWQPVANIPDLPGPSGPLNNIFKTLVSWCAAAVWMLFAIIWIGATIGLIARTITHRNWTMIVVLVPFVGISLLMALVLWAGISTAGSGVAKGVRKIFGRDRRS